MLQNSIVIKFKTFYVIFFTFFVAYLVTMIMVYKKVTNGFFTLGVLSLEIINN